MKKRDISISIIFIGFILAYLPIFSQQDLCGSSENSITKKNQYKVFACSNKRGSAYAEINFKFCASRTENGFKVVFNEIYYDADAPCNNLIPERMLISVFSSSEVLDKLNIKSAGEISDVEVLMPKMSNSIESKPQGLMTAKNCKKTSAYYLSQFDIMKATVILKESCEKDSGGLEVEKIKIHSN